jgi:hypothetical protein
MFMPTGNHPLTSFLSGPKNVRGCAAVGWFQILVGLQLRFRTQRIEIMNSKCFPQSWRIILAGGAGTLVAGLIVTCHAAEFSANGSAGDLSAPFLEVGPASAPVLLDVPNTLSGGYSAYAQVEVGFGLVRASAHNSGDVGTQSLGSTRASVSGTWADTLTFTAPEIIPGLPGVSIVPGTPGRAYLFVHIAGELSGLADLNGYARSSYGASLSYQRVGLPGDFRSVDGTYDANSPFDGTPLGTTLALPVDFTFGEALTVQFSLYSAAEVGWEGIASFDYTADALLNHTATWGGVQDMTALVSVEGGPVEPVSLPDGSWSLTSPTFDYSSPVVVPEPGALAMIMLGATGLLLRSHRRRIRNG